MKNRADKLAAAVSGFTSSGVGPKVSLADAIERCKETNVCPMCNDIRTVEVCDMNAPPGQDLTVIPCPRCRSETSQASGVRLW